MLQFPSSAFYLPCSLFFYNSVQVLLQYNEGLLSKQERCKHFIIRQLEVSGRDVTEEEVNEMVATGKWEVFNENLLNDARITRSQLSEIEQRHKVRQSCCGTDRVPPRNVFSTFLPIRKEPNLIGGVIGVMLLCCVSLNIPNS